MTASSASQPSASPETGEARRRAPVEYAGFWLRLAAYIIDSILLGFVVGTLILMPLMARAGISADNPWAFYTSPSRQIVAMQLLVAMASWLYWALMESSPWQATLGKKALGLLVTDLEGHRVSFGRASGRYFGKIISWLALLIGFIMAGLTERKQALHDILAGCLVTRKV
jgi:uncharacterized RDD family membrane protein YckC